MQNYTSEKRIDLNTMYNIYKHIICDKNHNDSWRT